MQRAQRGIDNHAVDLAVHVANLLDLPLVVYFAGISNFPHANLRHYAFLNQGLPDIEADLAVRNISFVMRRARTNRTNSCWRMYVQPFSLEMKIRCANRGAGESILPRESAFRSGLLDTGCYVVPSKLIEKAQYGAYTIRPRLYKLLPDYLVPYENPHAQHAWKRPRGFHSDSVHEDMTRGWKDFDRSVAPVEAWQGGTHAAALKRVKLFAGRLPEGL